MQRCVRHLKLWHNPLQAARTLRRGASQCTHTLQPDKPRGPFTHPVPSLQPMQSSTHDSTKNPPHPAVSGQRNRQELSLTHLVLYYCGRCRPTQPRERHTHIRTHKPQGWTPNKLCTSCAKHTALRRPPGQQAPPSSAPSPSPVPSGLQGSAHCSFTFSLTGLDPLLLPAWSPPAPPAAPPLSPLPSA